MLHVIMIYLIGLIKIQVTRSVSKKQKRLEDKAKKLHGVNTSPEKLKSDISKLKMGLNPKYKYQKPVGILSKQLSRNVGSLGMQYRKNPYFDMNEIVQKEELLVKSEGSCSKWIILTFLL